MKNNKKYRADRTYMIRTDITDNPKLGAKALSDGRESLFLDFNYGYSMAVSRTSGKTYAKKHRRREYLKLYLLQKPRTPQQRLQNRETLQIAKKIRFERAQQLLLSADEYPLRKDTDINFLDWMHSYHTSYAKADKGHIKRARDCFIDFLTTTPAFARFSLRIRPDQISRQMISAFTAYLRNRFIGEGAHTLYARFKKIIKAAAEAGLFKNNPCDGISIKIDHATLRKDVLSLGEIKLLIDTHYKGENPHVRRAFIFSCYSGLRWCDIRALTFANIDYANRLLKFEQAKTRGRSAASGVVIPLNEGLLRLIGTPLPNQRKDSPIFPLPSHTQCLKTLKTWVKTAGIDKHITWHCARHSFAVNILNNGANIKTLASLLGHSGLRHTEKYTRALDPLKQQAIDS
ncbi:MAG: site-specific integrase, partial [Muribaculaceae bacterium]|nr:site-specific integrase [Muribaculaceae bacterium]